MTKSRVFYRDSVAAADPEDADASEGLRRAPAPAPSPKPIRAQRLLVNTLLDQRADVANRVREAIVARIPAYRAIRREAVDAEVWHQFERALRSASGGHAGLDEPQWAETGASRAREAYPSTTCCAPGVSVSRWSLSAQARRRDARALTTRRCWSSSSRYWHGPTSLWRRQPGRIGTPSWRWRWRRTRAARRSYGARSSARCRPPNCECTRRCTDWTRRGVHRRARPTR